MCNKLQREAASVTTGPSSHRGRRAWRCYRSGMQTGTTGLLSNRGQVLIGGQRVPVIGRVCMDMTMVDVTDVRGATIGDEAILIGQQGSERITAADLAAWQQTIPYEILCAIGPRVPRRYLPLVPPADDAR